MIAISIRTCICQNAIRSYCSALVLRSVWSLCIGLRDSEQKTVQHGRVSDYIEFYRKKETGSSSNF